MNKSKHLEPIEFNVNTNPIASKAFLGILTKMPAHEIVVLCMREILDGMQLNVNDLPFYAAALDVVCNTIKGRFTDGDQKLYTKLISYANTIVVDAEKLKEQAKAMRQETNHDNNESSTESTQDTSENTTETYEGHPVNPEEFMKMLNKVFDDDNEKDSNENE